MKKLLLIVTLLGIAPSAFSQTNPSYPPMRAVAALPATCSTSGPDVFVFKTTTGGSGVGAYRCSAANTWTFIGAGREPVNVVGTVTIDTTGLATEATLDRVADAVEDTAPVAVNPFGGTIIRGAVTSAMTGTTSTEVIAGVASNYQYITWCVVSNASLTVSTDILLQNGSGGTTLGVLPAPAASVATTGGGGGMFVFPTPIQVPTVATGLFAANVTTGSSTKITCGGWRSTVSYS